MCQIDQAAIHGRIIVIALSIIFVGCGTSSNDLDTEIKRIFQVSHQITSIDPQTTDYSDLIFLKDIVKDMRIVMLGEQGHGDGSTFLAKTKIIKYLHQECDFSVLAFESSLFDCHFAWDSIQKGVDPTEAFSQGVFKVWAESVQVQDLIHYIAEKASTDDPLILTGFDMNYSGSMSDSQRVSIIQEFTEKLDLDQHYDSLFTILGYDSFQKRRFGANSNQQNYFFSELDKLYNELISRKDHVDQFWLKALSNIERSYYFFLHSINNLSNANIMNIRDYEMAQNIMYLTENVYPGKKMIVWGANSHLCRNRDQLLFKPDSMISAGDVLDDKYGEDIYTIAFTSYSGHWGSLSGEIYPALQASNKSIEYAMHLAGLEYAFLELDDLAKGSNITARAFGYLNWPGKWSEMADAFFYIDEMQPSTRLLINN